MNIDKLISALENDNNESIINNDKKTIAKMKNDILQNLGVSREELKRLHNLLKEYRFIDELPELQYGRYIRWINLREPNNIKLTKGGVICDITVDEEGITIICKNFMNKHFQLNMNEALIFQKITHQEQIILSALDYLNK